MREADTKEANVFSQPNDFKLGNNANDGNPLQDSSSRKVTKVTIFVVAGVLIGLVSRKRLYRLLRYIDA